MNEPIATFQVRQGDLVDVLAHDGHLCIAARDRSEGPVALQLNRDAAFRLLGGLYLFLNLEPPLLPALLVKAADWLDKFIRTYPQLAEVHHEARSMSEQLRSHARISRLPVAVVAERAMKLMKSIQLDYQEPDYPMEMLDEELTAIGEDPVKLREQAEYHPSLKGLGDAIGKPEAWRRVERRIKVQVIDRARAQSMDRRNADHQRDVNRAREEWARTHVVPPFDPEERVKVTVGEHRVHYVRHLGSEAPPIQVVLPRPIDLDETQVDEDQVAAELAKMPDVPLPSSVQLLGRELYETYCESSGWLNFQGNPCPQWPSLTDAVRVHWTAVARHVMQRNFDNRDR